MGTEISLDIGGMSIEWSKNARGADHGALFQEVDRKRLRSDQIDYGYFAESAEDPGRMEMALARPLRDVVPRLELLGSPLRRRRPSTSVPPKRSGKNPTNSVMTSLSGHRIS